MIWAPWNMSSKQNIFLLAITALHLSGCVHQSTPLVSSAARIAPPFPRVHFPTKSDHPTVRDRPAIAANAAWLVQHQEVAILLEGHADARGAAEENLALGDRRARRIAAMLMEQGVPTRQIVGVTSRGEAQPVVTSAGRAGWAADRRVECIVR